LAFPSLRIQADLTTRALTIPTFTTDWSDRLRNGLTIHQGRQRTLGKTETGSMRAPLGNQDRGLDPTVNLSLRPNNHVKCEAVWNGNTYSLFRGFVRRYPQDWPARRDAVSTIECEDAFALMARYELEGQAIAEMGAGAHITAVLTNFGWPGVGAFPPGTTWWQLGHAGSALGTNTFLGGNLQSIGTGRSTIMAMNTTGNMLEHLLNVAENTDRGTLYIGPTGDVVFKQKPSPHDPIVGTWGDGVGEYPYFDFSVDYDDVLWFNDIRVTRRGDSTEYTARQTPPTSSPIMFSNLGATSNPDLASGIDATSYVNSSWTPPTSGLIIATVYSRRFGGGDPITPTMSGNGVAWVQIATVMVAGTHRLTLFGANASGSTTGATTVDFGAETQDFMHVNFMGATGVNLSGGAAAAFVQAPTGGTSGTSASISLSIGADPLNRLFAAFSLSTTPGMTARSGWTPADDQAAFTAESQTQHRSGAFDTAASATWDGTSRAWVGIAVELKADIPPSSADDGFRTLPVSDTLFSTAAAASGLASELLSTYDEPVVYPARLVQRPRADSAIWSLILGMPLMSKIKVRRRPPGTGAVIELDCYVIGITYNIGQFWEITWDLAAAETLLDAWYLGTVGFSELGTTTILG
jgi:hypothetical protein